MRRLRDFFSIDDDNHLATRPAGRCPKAAGNVIEANLRAGPSCRVRRPSGYAWKPRLPTIRRQARLAASSLALLMEDIFSINRSRSACECRPTLFGLSSISWAKVMLRCYGNERIHQIILF